MTMHQTLSEYRKHSNYIDVLLSASHPGEEVILVQNLRELLGDPLLSVAREGSPGVTG